MIESWFDSSSVLVTKRSDSDVVIYVWPSDSTIYMWPGAVMECCLV